MLQALAAYLIVAVAAGWLVRALFTAPNQKRRRSAAGKALHPKSGITECPAACDACAGCLPRRHRQS